MRTRRKGLTGQIWTAALLGAVATCLAVPEDAFAQEAPGGAAPVAAPAKAKAKKPKAAAAPADGGEAAGPVAGAPAAKDPAVALAAYTAGVKAYQAGKFDAAVGSLSSAINNGGLTAAQMPKALYYRGAALQQQGKSGQAISDLTSAMWFKPGLEEAERVEATKLRAAAYRDAGLDDTGQAVRAATSGTDAGAPAGRMSALPSESQAAAPAGIGKVFGNLFGGASSPAAPPAPAAVSQAPAGGEPEVLPWANRPVTPAADAEAPAETGTVAPPAAAPAAKVAKPKAPVAAKVPVAPKASGGVRIQVASVKSRDEASAVIAKLQGVIAGASASVDETTFGANTFYRVKLGPFASAAATAGPCKALKAQGFDCLVTPN